MILLINFTPVHLIKIIIKNKTLLCNLKKKKERNQVFLSELKSILSSPGCLSYTQIFTY